VDFDAPLGYKEPERSAQHEETTDVEADHSGYVNDIGFRAFSGSGNRLDGKKKGVEPSPSPIKPGDIRRGIPNYDFKIGRITFIRNSRPLVKKVEEDESGSRFIAFSGEGQSLRKKGRKP
ncbi:UFD1 protein, partial [Oxylabes madagascariensis]|nr:UFD1 protein [Oxylabes madagascariensis]